MKKLFAILLTVVLCLSMVSCGIVKDSHDVQLEGTYAHTKFREGIQITSIISLYDDGTYQTITIWDDYIKACKKGDYELDDGKVKLYDSDSIVYHGSATLYSFENGTLTGPETVYKKISEE